MGCPQVQKRRSHRRRSEKGGSISDACWPVLHFSDHAHRTKGKDQVLSGHLLAPAGPAARRTGPQLYGRLISGNTATFSRERLPRSPGTQREFPGPCGAVCISSLNILAISCGLLICVRIRLTRTNTVQPAEKRIKSPGDLCMTVLSRTTPLRHAVSFATAIAMSGRGPLVIPAHPPCHHPFPYLLHLPGGLPVSVNGPTHSSVPLNRSCPYADIIEMAPGLPDYDPLRSSPWVLTSRFTTRAMR